MLGAHKAVEEGRSPCLGGQCRDSRREVVEVQSMELRLESQMMAHLEHLDPVGKIQRFGRQVKKEKLGLGI